MTDQYDLLVIGGGVAGMQAALDSACAGLATVLVERSPGLGGFSMSLAHSTRGDAPSAIAARMAGACSRQKGLTVLTGAHIGYVRREDEGIVALLANSEGLPAELRARSLIIATGMEPVDVSLIPEYGHGRLPGVLTSAELEMDHPSVPCGDVRSVAFIQCVGSRVERRGVPYCSGYCCASAVKNACLLKNSDPGLNVHIFYIDVRTCGRGEEHSYREARRLGVKFIRGQPAMVRQKDGRLLVCGENTLVNELYEVPADRVILSAGMQLSAETKRIAMELGLVLDEEGLIHVDDLSVPVLVAGCAESPKGVEQSREQGSHCANRIIRSLKC